MKLKVVIFIAAIITVLFCSCSARSEPFKCYFCGAEETETRHELNYDGVKVEACDDCYAELKAMQGAF